MCIRDSTYRDAPNVDGYIFINTDETLMTGDICKVMVTGAYELSLIHILKLRGPGDFFGIRQSGDLAFALADVYQDSDVLKLSLIHI